MEYAIKPLGNFIGYSYSPPLTREEYQARAYPQGGGKNSPVSDIVDLSSGGGRDALVKSLTRGSGSFDLLGTLIPSASSLGGSYGLYAGVGEIPYYKVKSLIDKYV